MANQIVCKCPLCGMVVLPQRMEDGPYDIQVYLKQIGGKVKGDRKGRGKAKGFIKMELIDAPDITKEVKKCLVKIYDKIQ